MMHALGLLHADLRAKALFCYGDDGVMGLSRAIGADGTLAMVLYRLAQGARESKLGLLEMAFCKLNSQWNGCVIGRGAELGPGFVLLHSGGVVINGRVRGGADVRVEHQVTLGDDGSGGVPELGDGVYVGAGAKVIGPVRVGSGARVGANAVVVHDVEPHTTVVGIPARPVTRRTRRAPI